jgi:hypothetical protein
MQFHNQREPLDSITVERTEMANQDAVPQPEPLREQKWQTRMQFNNQNHWRASQWSQQNFH